MTHVKIVSFTERGAETGRRIAALLPEMLTERYERTADPSLGHTSLSRWAQQAMVDCDGIVFVGAAGIAVRAAAPYLAGKAFDPAVIVVDESGRYVIPLLSGHLGGANELAARLAGGLEAEAVITTATDGRNVFAVDTWAKEQGMKVHDPENIKHVSGAILRGDTVGLRTEYPVDGRLPAHVSLTAEAEAGFYIGFDPTARPFAHTLHLIPRTVFLGIGCRRGTDAETIFRAADEALQKAGAPWDAVLGVSTIDLKGGEAGLLLFCQQRGLPLDTYTADELNETKGTFTPSAFVKKTVGVDNVCERAAVRAAGNGRLLCRKTARDGATAAVAAMEWRISF